MHRGAGREDRRALRHVAGEARRGDGAPQLAGRVMEVGGGGRRGRLPENRVTKFTRRPPSPPNPPSPPARVRQVSRVHQPVPAKSAKSAKSPVRQ
eukprot:gene9638-biopygen3350